MKAGNGAAASNRVLLISQVFTPDPAAVGQYLSDVADGVAEQGVPVTVLTANRGYHDSSERYESETRDGLVTVKRLRFSSFGKRNMLFRVLGQVSFLVQAILRGLLTKSVGSVLVTTSPPMGQAAALVIGKMRRLPVTYWVMDINPDQAIAVGKVRPGALSARVLETVDKALLNCAQSVITLDHDLAERLESKADITSKLAIVPLWSMLDERAVDQPSSFASENNPDDSLLVMYSGNHSLVHPLDTLLGAADRLSSREDLRFVFVGDGHGKRAVEELIARSPDNRIASLPYQPLDSLSDSLSAADVHVVTMGDDMVGLVHPSKIYNAMAMRKPILYIGPPSALSRLIEARGTGWCFSHGDVDGVARLLGHLAENRSMISAAGQQADRTVRSDHRRSLLRRRVVAMASGLDVIESEQIDVVVDLRQDEAAEIEQAV